MGVCTACVEAQRQMKQEFVQHAALLQSYSSQSRMKLVQHAQSWRIGRFGSVKVTGDETTQQFMCVCIQQQQPTHQSITDPRKHWSSNAPREQSTMVVAAIIDVPRVAGAQASICVPHQERELRWTSSHTRGRAADKLAKSIIYGHPHVARQPIA